MILSKRSVFFILVSVLIWSAGGMAFYTYISRYLLFLETNISLIPLIVSIFALTAVIIPPFSGKLSDKFQNRFLFIIIGGIGMIFSFVLLLFVDNLFFIIITIFLYGVFSSFFAIIAVLYAELVENDKKFITYYTACVALGWFIGAVTCGFFVEIYGIEILFLYMLIISIATIIFIGFIREERGLILKSFQNSKEHQNENIINHENEDISPISKSIYPSLLFRNLGVRSILSVLAIIMAFHLSSDVEIGILIGMNPLIQFFLVISLGKVLNDNNLKSFMVIGYLLNAVAIFILIVASTFLGFLIFQIIISISYSMFWTATMVYIAENTTPENKGKYMGYANTSFYLGSLIGGVLFSALVAIFSNYYTAMYFMIIFPILSGLIIMITFDKKKIL